MIFKSIFRALGLAIKGLIFVAVLLLATGSTYLWFEGDDLLKRWTPEIEAELGRQVRADVEIADLRLRLFPRLAISLNAVTFRPNSSCGRIFAENGSLSIDLLSLLGGEYLIDHIYLNGIRASVSNLNDTFTLVNDVAVPCEKSLATPSVIPSEALAPGQTQIKDGDSSRFLSLELEKLEIEDLRLSVSGKEPHTIVISRLTSAALLKNDKLTLTAPQMQASIDLIPVSLGARSAQVDLNNFVLSVEGVALNLAGQSLQVSGTIKSLAEFQDIKIKTENLQLPQLAEVLRSFGLNPPKITAGVLNISAVLNTSRTSGLEVKGNLQLTKVKIAPLQLNFAELGLQALSFKRDPGGNIEVSALTSVRQLSVIDREFSYAAGKADGPVSFKQNPNGGSLLSQLTVTGFEFSDRVTELKNVSARLSDVTGKWGKNGELKFTLNLLGSSIELRNPAVKVKRVQSVSAPLAIEIPAAGGYTVSGLINATGGSVILSGRELNDVSGTVRMLVSSPLNEFTAQSLVTGIAGRVVSTVGTFSMNPEMYLFKGIKTSLNRGKITLDGKIHRRTGRAFSADLALSDVPINDLMSVVEGVDDSRLEGTIALFRSSPSGSLDAPLASLNGKGALQIVGPKIKGFELSRAIADALGAIPFANIKLSADNLAEEGLTRTAEGEFLIGNQMVTFTKATIYKPHYTVQVRGNVSFQQELNMVASAVFARETMKMFGAGFDKLGALMGRLGKVEIPLFIRGKVPDVSVSPDLVTLARDNSGITLASNVLDSTISAGRAVTDFVLSPFGSGKRKDAVKSGSGN